MATVTISDETKQKFPDLVELILGSESMTDEDRQYWINILPVMTPDQVKSLREILDNEKKQLAEIDEKYSKEIEEIGEDELLAAFQEERDKRRMKLSEQEMSQEEAESSEEEDILKRIKEQ